MREQKFYLVSRETLHKQQDKKTMNYTKNVVHEGLKLKGSILLGAIYQIGDAAYPFVLENIVIVLQILK